MLTILQLFNKSGWKRPFFVCISYSRHERCFY